ncbi:MAG: hypothetical protein FWF65_03380 [Bacteroidetes bacterium]|nr:hypothetical protein [Bacteroidota bacterium]
MKIQKFILTCLITNLLFCFSCKSKVEPRFESETIEEYVIPFTVTDNYRILLEGVFKDSVYLFMLDNGWAMTTLPRTLFTRYYDIEKLNMSVSEWNGDAQTCVMPNQIKFANYEFLFDRIGVDDHVLLGKELSFLGGIIGAELFHRHIIELNFEDSIMIIRSKLPENICEYMSFDLQNFEHYAYQMDSLFKQIEISGFYDHKGNAFTGKFWVDLGCPFVVFLKTIREQTDFNYSKQDTNTLASFILNNGVIVEDSHLRTGSASGKDINPELRLKDGMLGTPFLANFHVIFDYPNNKLYLKRNKLTCKFKIL